jgi:hypothetical protein
MKGYQGTISKSARVYSNDPKNRQATLTLTASVKVPIHLNPNSVCFSCKEGERITRTVSIKAGLEKPLKLTKDTFTLAEKLDYRIEKLKKDEILRSISLATRPPRRPIKDSLSSRPTMSKNRWLRSI